MHTTHNSPVTYQLNDKSEQAFTLNDAIGKNFSIKATGNIFCVACGNKTKNSFRQGYCYPCTLKLAQCDICIIKPEQCHYDQGTCREPQWGETHCFQDHTVYLAKSSHIKVGITRATPTRWIDQGAVEALPIYKVKNRLISGLVETIYKNYVSDKTDWRKMLKNITAEGNLIEMRQQLFSESKTEMSYFSPEISNGIEQLTEEPVVKIEFPVLEYPKKITSANLQKKSLFEGQMMGIKGQYVLLDTGVLNIRKFAGYEVEIEFS